MRRRLNTAADVRSTIPADVHRYGAVDPATSHGLAQRGPEHVSPIRHGVLVGDVDPAVVVVVWAVVDVVDGEVVDVVESDVLPEFMVVVDGLLESPDDATVSPVESTVLSDEDPLLLSLAVLSVVNAPEPPVLPRKVVVGCDPAVPVRP